MIYFEIVQFMISKIFEFDFDDENFDNENIANETFVVESSTINDETIISSKFNEKIFDFQIVNFFEQLFLIEQTSIDDIFTIVESNEQNSIEFFNFLFRIKKVYKIDKKLQLIMKTKKIDQRKISAKLIKKKIRLKLKNCEIKFDFFWIKKRLHMFRKKSLQIDVIKHIHEFFQKKHVDRIIIYNRLIAHYYWQNMTNFVIKYIKFCHHCKRIKTYKKIKQKLFKSLLIFDRYFRKITIDFVIFLLVCKRANKNYQHIMIIIDKLFKTKKFAILKSLNVDFVI